jgi:Mrp family chromosome partitioning ATPase
MNQNDETAPRLQFCSETCSSRKTDPSDFLERPHDMSISNVSLGLSAEKARRKISCDVNACNRTETQKHAYRILDPDITGPSIPKIFGVGNEKPQAVDGGMYPVKSDTGIDIMSINLLLEHENDPVIWRGPIIAAW